MVDVQRIIFYPNYLPSKAHLLFNYREGGMAICTDAFVFCAVVINIRPFDFHPIRLSFNNRIPFIVCVKRTLAGLAFYVAKKLA